MHTAKRGHDTTRNTSTARDKDNFGYKCTGMVDTTRNKSTTSDPDTTRKIYKSRNTNTAIETDTIREGYINWHI